MSERIAGLAYKGNWAELMPLLRQSPRLLNVASEPKGYTVLHQAAWHGAGLPVIGELLALGADRYLTTRSKGQTPHDIAIEKHTSRQDLRYVLASGRRTLSQLIRKAVAETPELFDVYDGNQALCDRLVECFVDHSFSPLDHEVDLRIEAAIYAMTGADLRPARTFTYGPYGIFELRADMRLWTDRLLPILREYASRAHCIPIEREWAVVSDVFDPAPDCWGLRGDLFLWIEMRQALCHVTIPPQSEGLAQTISSAFTSLTGVPLATGEDVFVPRFARGGMSSGFVSCDYWANHFIPLLIQRFGWLQATWSWQSSKGTPMIDAEEATWDG